MTMKMLQAGKEKGGVRPGKEGVWRLMGIAYFLLLRASELWAYDDTKKVHATFGLTRSSLVFKKGLETLEWSRKEEGDRVEIRFLGAKNDQERVGHTLVRCRQRSGEKGAFELIMEVVKEQERGDREVSGEVPLCAVQEGRGWKLVTRKEAVEEFRFLVEKGGGVGKEYALHSFRIGGATAMAAAGCDAFMIMKEGRWKSFAFMAYIRSVLADSRKVSEMLVTQDIGGNGGSGMFWE
jgi:hypothetical protein